MQEINFIKGSELLEELDKVKKFTKRLDSSVFCDVSIMSAEFKVGYGELLKDIKKCFYDHISRVEEELKQLGVNI